MKLYHIDRGCTINSKYPIDLVENIFSQNKITNEAFQLVQKNYYEEGISQHGIHYFLNNDLAVNNAMQLSGVMEIILEYERLLNYPDKLSRYQALFAFDNKGALQFIKEQHLENSFFKVYEVEADHCERHNMTLISGSRHCDITAMAKLYWENKKDPYNRPILNEYLLKFPVNVIKEVSINELDYEKTI